LGSIHIAILQKTPHCAEAHHTTYRSLTSVHPFLGDHLPRSHCVRWDLASPKGAQPPQFSAHVCCGQTAGWIKMPLGTELGLSPGDIVIDGDLAPPKRGTFRRMSIVAKRLDGSRPGHIVLDRDPIPPKGQSSPFRSMSIVAKRSPISATAELLLNSLPFYPIPRKSSTSYALQ